MITWCGDPGWAAWMMTGGRSPAARWARRRLCEAERDAAVIEHAALRIRLDAGFLAARCLDVRIALLTLDAEDLIASAGGCGDRLRRPSSASGTRFGILCGPGTRPPTVPSVTRQRRRSRRCRGRTMSLPKSGAARLRDDLQEGWPRSG
jgi:hypothetical protein